MNNQNFFSVCRVVFAIMILSCCFYCQHSAKGKNNPFDPNSENYIYLNAGNDTTVSMYSKIHLHGRVSQNEEIEKWEWKFSNNNWVRTSSGDTTIIAPGYEGIYPCTLKVTNTKGFSVYSTVNITVQNLIDSLILIKSSDSIVGIYDTFHIQVEIDKIVTVKKLEWKFGDNGWVETLGNDTTIMAPEYELIFPCSLKVTNDFGTTLYASVKVAVSANNSKLLSIVVNDSIVGVGDTVQFHGEVSNLVTVQKGEWKFGNLPGVETIGGDTNLIFSFNSQAFICDLRVTNNFNTKIFATKKITIYFTNIANVYAGGLHSLFLTSDKTLWATGENDLGQLGNDTLQKVNTPRQLMNDVSSASAGATYTMIIKTDGTLWATGDNSYGQLGDGTNENKSKPVQIMSGVVSVSAGGCIDFFTPYKHTMIIKSDGTLWVTGSNKYGQLGDGTNTDRNLPVQIMSGVASASVGGFQTMIVMTDRTLWATGNNQFGQLGDGTNAHKNIPVQIMNNVSYVSVGGYHAMIIKTDGTLWATGYNKFGQLGDGTNDNKNQPVQIMSGVAFVSAGWLHTMILKTDGTLWATGNNDMGQLGDGTNISKNLPVQIMSDVASVSAGGALVDGFYIYENTLIIKNDGTLWVTGANNKGQLGDGTYYNKNIPLRI